MIRKPVFVAWLISRVSADFNLKTWLSPRLLNHMAIANKRKKYSYKKQPVIMIKSMAKDQVQ